MIVTYPICIFQDNETYYVEVPDLNTNFTYGDTLEEALFMAQDLIAVYILDDLGNINNNVIPKQSNFEDIDLNEAQQKFEKTTEVKIINSFKNLISVNLEEFARKYKNAE